MSDNFQLLLRNVLDNLPQTRYLGTSEEFRPNVRIILASNLRLNDLESSKWIRRDLLMSLTVGYQRA